MSPAGSLDRQCAGQDIEHLASLCMKVPHLGCAGRHRFLHNDEIGTVNEVVARATVAPRARRDVRHVDDAGHCRQLFGSAF
jgi:hypothetical protein